MQINNDIKTNKLLSLIGDHAFTRLCAVFGGKPLQVASHSVSLRKQLSMILGKVNADRVMTCFNGVELTLPTSSILEIKKQHQAMIKDAGNGMSCGDIAVKYSMTYQQARRIIHQIYAF